jgi:hypothetical protein
LYHYRFLFVGNGANDFRGVVHFYQRSYRTNGNALSAECTRRVAQFLVESGRNYCGESAFNGIQRAYGLKVVAHRFATAAHHTFIHIANDRRRRFHFVR